MVDDNLLGKLFSATAAAWTFVLMCAVALFKAWPNIMARLNERRRDAAAEKAEDWHRLRAEIDRLHASIANRERLLAELDDERIELQKENISLLARAVKAEATLQGYGEARQRQAIEEATKRLPNHSGNGK